MNGDQETSRENTDCVTIRNQGPPSCGDDESNDESMVDTVGYDSSWSSLNSASSGPPCSSKATIRSKFRFFSLEDPLEARMNLKPIIVLVCPSQVTGFHKRYNRLLQRLRSEVRLMNVEGVDGLDAVIRQHEKDVRGFVVTDASIMQPQHELLTHRLGAILRLPFNKWSLVFAFDFPAQAALASDKFSAYMLRVFHVDWTISGVTRTPATLRWQEDAEARLAARRYPREYRMLAVLFGQVRQADRLLMLKTEATTNDLSKKNDHDTIANSDDISSQSTAPDAPVFKRIDPRNHPHDTPVAFHKITRGGHSSARRRVVGHLGIIGHVNDAKRLARLILGMCAIDQDPSS